jgi:transitional endoplasmic reticulum ATPase
LNKGEIDLDWVIKATARFTPADIQYLFEQVAQFAFEQEIARKEDYRVTTETIRQILPKINPTLTDEIIKEFEQDSITYARV